MSKAVLISIRPQWCKKIANGEKTIEVRKTRPKLQPPFRCYIYCTKAEERLLTIMKDGDENYGETYHGKPVFIKTETGSVCDMWGKRQKVIGEFTCDRIDTIVPTNEPYGIYDVDDDYVIQACLANGGLWDYGNGAVLFGWHISDLKIYDTPRELGEFWFPPELYCEKELCGGCPYDQVADVNGEYSYDCEWRRPLSRAPQSWCYVYVEGKP